jgi:hypothetical protein
LAFVIGQSLQRIELADDNGEYSGVASARPPLTEINGSLGYAHGRDVMFTARS